MCFSAEASYATAAALIPAGAFTINRAYRTNHRYLAVAALPVLFGFQQLFEGLAWTANKSGYLEFVPFVSLAYMFFAWLAWPIWIPFSTFFLEPCRRRYLYLVFAILGGVVGGLQYLPYFAHDGWLVTRFLPNAISFEGTVLFELIMRREITNVIYLFVILAPLLTSTHWRVNVFGILVSVVVGIVFFFFRYAYISVFCFGAAIMSLYLIYMVFKETEDRKTPLSC